MTDKIIIPPSPFEQPDYHADLERALMAYAAYYSYAEIETAVRDGRGARLGEFEMPKQWDLLKDENDNFIDKNDTSGLVAAAFVNERERKVVIAYRGSDNLVDYTGANVALSVDGQPLAAAGVPFIAPKGDKPIAQMAEVQKALYPGDQWHPQFTDALDYAHRLKEKYEPLGYTFEVVGHSLGGSESQLVGHTFGWGGRTFDALGAQNLTESQGYKTWLAQHGMERAEGVPSYVAKNPQADNFLNYGARYSRPSTMTGPHLGDMQGVSALAGRQGLASHLTYVAATADAVVSEVPLVGDFLAVRSGLRAAKVGELGTFVGREMAQSMALSGADAAERHGMANFVRKFEIAARTGELPTFGREDDTVPEVDRRLAPHMPRMGAPLPPSEPARREEQRAASQTPLSLTSNPSAFLDHMLAAAQSGDHDAFRKATQSAAQHPAAREMLVEASATIDRQEQLAAQQLAAQQQQQEHAAPVRHGPRMH